MITNPFAKTEPNSLETEIERLFEELKTLTPSDDNYSAVADQLSKLYKLKEIDSKKRVSPDALAAAATNILGILLVINFEHLNVIRTKAFGMVMRNVMK